MNKMKIAICDDEELQIKLLTKIVGNWAKRTSTEVQILTFTSAESFSFAWSNDKSFDILLLDIQMSGQNGIELAKVIREKDDKLSIIFITGLSEYINEGYEVSAIHYLLKPVKEEKLYECLDKACKKIIIEEKTILVSCNGENIRVLLSEIIYIESQGHYIFIKTQRNKYRLKMNLSDVEKSLDNSFFRCQRSFIVGLKHIRKTTRTAVFLEKDIEIPMSRGIYDEVNQALINYFK